MRAIKVRRGTRRLKKKRPSPAQYLDLGVGTRWIVVANQEEASIYADRRGRRRLSLIEQLEEPSGGLKERDLVSDRPGRVFSSAGRTIHHATSSRVSHHKMIAERFAARIARRLVAAHREGDFGELVVVAGPRFLGLLRRALSRSLKPRALQGVRVREVGCEFVNGNEKELRDAVHKALA